MPDPSQERSEHARAVGDLMQASKDREQERGRELSADEARVAMEQRLSQMPIPAQEPMLQFFAYAHLPEKLRDASRPFCELAQQVIKEWPRNPERTVALRKLLEAKDAAVRSILYQG